MARSRRTPGGVKIPAAVVAELNTGRRESANLAECLAVDFHALARSVLPEARPGELAPLAKADKLGITERMRRAGQLLLDRDGLDGLPEYRQHSSDTVRGWACYTVGQAPGLALDERLELIRPLADDPHSGVREWAWLAVRPHVAADIEEAIALLESWTGEESAYLRRFATESTRPRGVWSEHVPRLIDEPRLGLPLLQPLRRPGGLRPRLGVELAERRGQVAAGLGAGSGRVVGRRLRQPGDTADLPAGHAERPRRPRLTAADVAVGPGWCKLPMKILKWRPRRIVMPIKIDSPELRAMIERTSDTVDFRDEGGRVFASFLRLPYGVPPPDFQMPWSDEEIAPRRQERDGKPLAEILAAFQNGQP